MESTRRQAAVDKQVYTDVTLGPGPSSKKGIGRPKRTAGSSLLNPSIKKWVLDISICIALPDFTLSSFFTGGRQLLVFYLIPTHKLTV